MTEERESMLLSESMNVQLRNGDWKYLNDEIIKEFKAELEEKVITDEGESISAESTLLDDDPQTKMYVQMLFKAKYDTDIIDYVYFQGTRSYVYGGQADN